MSEYGTVKGTFVVISKGSGKFLVFAHTKKITPIAKNTYRLEPEDGFDFNEYYRSLLNSARFEQVEMEIDYSQKSRQLPLER